MCFLWFVIWWENTPCWDNIWPWPAAAHWFSQARGQQRCVLALLPAAHRSPASQRLLLSGGRLSLSPYPGNSKRGAMTKTRWTQDRQGRGCHYENMELQWEASYNTVIKPVGILLFQLRVIIDTPIMLQIYMTYVIMQSFKVTDRVWCVLRP